jgi:DNA-directed RNA polymerase subunit RPC12/RpoP
MFGRTGSYARCDTHTSFAHGKLFLHSFFSRVGKMAEAWIGVSSMYKCIECGEPFISLFISYGEPATFEYPLVCRYHWKKGGLKNAIKTILNANVKEKVELIARLMDFLEAV